MGSLIDRYHPKPEHRGVGWPVPCLVPLNPPPPGLRHVTMIAVWTNRGGFKKDINLGPKLGLGFGMAGICPNNFFSYPKQVKHREFKNKVQQMQKPGKLVKGTR